METQADCVSQEPQPLLESGKQQGFIYSCIQTFRSHAESLIHQALGQLLESTCGGDTVLPFR